MKKRLIINRNYKAIIIVAFYVLFFLYGCFSVADYGLGGDDIPQRMQSLVVYKKLVPSVANIHTNYVDFPSMGDSSGIMYGVLIQLPLVFIEHIFGFQLNLKSVFLMRHLYIFLLFFISTIYMYKIGRIAFKKRSHAFLAVLILIISPRILAESFYNIKDSVELSLFIINIYYGIKFIKRPDYKAIIPLIIISALTTTVRITGALVLFFSFIIAFLKTIANGEKWKKVLLLMLGAGVGCFTLYVLAMPSVWADPFGAINRIIQTFSNYTIWEGRVYFTGEYLTGDQLPWYYLLVWVVFTIPLCYSLLCILGIVSWIRRCINIKKGEIISDQFWYELLFVLLLIVPIMYVIVCRPILYNGWRHFYFIYSVITLLAVNGFIYLMCICKKYKIVQRGIMMSIFISMFSTITWTFLAHPYQYAYFNPFVRNYAIDNMEKDYWVVGERDAIEFIAKTDNRENISVNMTEGNSLLYLDENDQARIHCADTIDDADYVIHRYVSSPSKDWTDEWQYYNEVFDIHAGNIKLYSVFQEKYKLYSINIIEGGTDKITYSINDIGWEVSSDEGNTILIGTFKQNTAFDKVLLYNKSNVKLKNIKILVSSDGYSWIDLADNSNYTVEGNIISALNSTEKVKYFKLIFKEVEKFSFQINILQDIQTESKVVSPIDTVLGHQDSIDSMNAVDNNYHTNWHTGPQRSDLVLDITLKDIQNISGLYLDPGEWRDDYVRNVNIYVSVDGTEWKKIDYVTYDNIKFLFESTEAKYIRLITGNIETDIKNDWTISEIVILTDD